MPAVIISERQLQLLLLVYPFRSITRRVLEYAYSVRVSAETTPAEVRDDLRQLRAAGFLERSETADAPGGVSDVVYTLTPAGERKVLGSEEFAKRRLCWAVVERRRPGLSTVLECFELVLAPTSDLFRVVEYQILADAPEQPGRARQPDVRALIDCRMSVGQPWGRRTVAFALGSGLDRYRRVGDWCRAHNWAVSHWGVLNGDGGDEPVLHMWGAAQLIVVMKSRREVEEFLRSTPHLGWDRSQTVQRTLHRYGGMVTLTSAESWSEVRPVRASGATLAARHVLVLRHPRDIQRELFMYETVDARASAVLGIETHYRGA